VSPDAKVIVLKPSEQRVLEFQRYAARLKARGRVVARGDTLIAYRVHKTVPEGPVTVTDSTEFIFAV